MADQVDAQKMPLLDHLIELRQRLLYSVITLFVAFLICFYFAQPLFDFLVQPLADILAQRETIRGGGRRLIFTDLTEVFFTYVKVAFFTAAFLCCPVFLTQFWLFVAPGLYKNERQAALPFLRESTEQALLRAQRLADSIRRDMAPTNSWAIARRDKPPVFSGLEYSLAKVSEHLPVFDLWPVRYATSYEFQPGPDCPMPLPPDSPRFRRCYEPVGDFPEVALSFKSLLTRIFTAFGAGLAPGDRRELAAAGARVLVDFVHNPHGLAALGAMALRSDVGGNVSSNDYGPEATSLRTPVRGPGPGPLGGLGAPGPGRRAMRRPGRRRPRRPGSGDPADRRPPALRRR